MLKATEVEFTESGSTWQSIDKSDKRAEFKEYSFLSRTKTEQISAQAKGGKKRGRPAAADIEEDLSKFTKKKEVQVKKQTTIDLKKGKVSTVVVK